MARPLRSLGFLTIGLFDRHDPRTGHETTLSIIERGERLGFDSAWLRDRHLQYGISSPVAVLAAASQRTSRIRLGTAVIPLGWENPLRLAEDLATVDVLSGGRLEPGFSVGPPRRLDDVAPALYPDTAHREDFGYERLARLRRFLAGEPASPFAGTEGIEEYSERVEPHAAGLADRLWYGAGSPASTTWAAENGFHLLTSSVIRSTASTDFDVEQHAQIRLYRDTHPDGENARVSQGLVVIPTDSATPEQRRRYEAYAESRRGRVGIPQGPQEMLFAEDLVGTAEQIAERLLSSRAYPEVDEVAFALPFSFAADDYAQILDDIAGRLGPLLGWTPAEG
ncbi:Flavin-dependent oxidoreductase, luciferase family (includes alkanesulfonate monooxygenase SsuD and methylene tetrahydromethanopterin reductase) [Microbacterium hydrothermale]|uniref:LLM class flavin-dependent oxidoreductase n=1 Tax=Microbacterium hydrothermale TaxID=857427 RepID=UPI002225C508|nr:LLM class flavin-dependent oxidoreductase [Microbacterium hydrothermale]MCW2163181.1 Flavin-dependent oxidoreductase, luciferase family (includes alkanesulfonate monooxygenase SsuD and methylene tetrahydromethanopterin reductase) [Microbacterium hydrothermale]